MELTSQMPGASSYQLKSSPQESLLALERLVGQRFDWRIMTGSEDTTPRFVIEKRVRYSIIRGLWFYGAYSIIGGFQAAERGTTLTYRISGQGITHFIEGLLMITVLLIMTVLLLSLVLSPLIGGNWRGILLVGVMVIIISGYGWSVYRRYRGNLRELDEFMRAFARQMGGSA